LAQELSNEIIADSLYERAEQLYNLENPTTTTDQEAIDNYLEALTIYKKTDDKIRRVAECYEKAGIIYQDKGDLQNALNSYRNSVKAKSRVKQNADSLYFKELILIGNIYFYMSNYDSAENYYRQAAVIASKYDSLNHLVRLFNSTGALYQATGNFRQANNFFKRALSSLTLDERDYQRDKANIENNIALTELALGNYHQAISYYNKILQRSPFMSAAYENLGIAYYRAFLYDSAKYSYQKALNNSQRDITNVNVYNGLARIHTLNYRIDSSQYYLNKSLETIAEKYKSRNLFLSYTYLESAFLRETRKQLDSALHYYQLALINTTFDFNDSTVTANPSDITQAISLLHLFKVLRGKAFAWQQYYQQDHNPTKLNHSLATYQLAIRVAQHIQKTYDNDEAKLFLVNKVAPVYEEAIATAVQLHQLTNDPQYVAQAFQFSEASKASVLTESLRDVKIKSSGGVNDSLVQEERRVKQQITALRLKLVESQDSAQNERYRQQLIDQEIALARTIKYLQKDEHYYQRKYQPDSLEIVALQRSLLGGGETLLEYFVGQKELYVFALRRGDLRVASVARTAELDSALQRTQRHLYDYRPGQGDDEASLATLYRYLIAPVADAVADARKLIIVPDGPLHYLPFDLLSADGQRANHLIHTHTLHYGYSASLLQQAIDERRGYPTEAVLAMAPFAGGEAGGIRSQGFGRLRDSQAEVESVGGSIYTEGNATKRRFLRVAGSYNVLHLATHATVNDEDPSQSFIAFYPQQRDSVANYRLYTHELYNMRLDSVKLVILSACEAGNGQLVRGEGVMSLARAFAYAGCPNTVTTLWKADDRSSARLTARLHHYLKQGWEKDEALRQAKLDYLNNPEVHPAQKTPYYWANFVFIGDPAPIYDNYRWWWLAVGLLLVVLVGGLLLWRRREQRRVKQTA
jgi:CHAT domain-containing protein/tetratricopeptide (TPR) repeat protein